MASRLKDGTVRTQVTAKQKCVRCGQQKECRDVVKAGQPICFGCSTEAERRKYMARLLN